jgi:hypothetical protein
VQKHKDNTVRGKILKTSIKSLQMDKACFLSQILKMQQSRCSYLILNNLWSKGSVDFGGMQAGSGINLLALKQLLSHSELHISGTLNMQTQQKGKPVNVAFILSMVSGILIVSQGTLRFIRNQWGLELGIGEFRRSVVNGSGFRIISIVTILLGIIVLFGALLMRHGRTRNGGITVIAFSLLSIMSGGGYLAGLILGVIGGALAISEQQLPSNFTKEPLPES